MMDREEMVGLSSLALFAVIALIAIAMNTLWILLCSFVPLAMSLYMFRKGRHR